MKSGQLTPVDFVAKWSRVELSERAASQEHFMDLCRMLGQQTPAEHDSTGAEYSFEKGIAVTGFASAGSKGEHGFADVWWRGKFAWEYKRRGKYKDLGDAYRQLCVYREALDNPPLLIVSDIARTEIHTNFTGTAKQVHTIALADLAEPPALDLLRRVFTEPDSFKPTLTPEKVTEDVAKEFAALADRFRKRGHDPHVAAHFLMKCMFCLFAEDVGLLPNDLFKRLVESRRNNLASLTAGLTDLFDKMRTGGAFGVDDVPWFNGGLFDESPALELKPGDVDTLLSAAKHDWGSVEPAVFGTLFERSLDPQARAQIGAHYTSREDIMLIVEPVVLAPLRREWEAVKEDVEKQLARRRKGRTGKTVGAAEKAIEKSLQEFVSHLASVRILDPACGSGNFLYVAIQQLLNLEKEVITFAARPDIGVGMFPRVRPTQLHGIELNLYAAELAQVVIWIGYLQWMRDNGFRTPSDPILAPLQTIENRDAILDLSDPKLPVPAKWPEADFIIGNPPCLGPKMLRGGLGDTYVQVMFDVYEDKMPGFSDLCCYWFELARGQIEKNPSTRVGLLATQGIRGKESRTVLRRIKEHGQIFEAWSDREWILDGANVHVSIVCFSGKRGEPSTLDGVAVTEIHEDLFAGSRIADAKQLVHNERIGFVADVKAGAFDIEWTIARNWLARPNPNGRSNSRVLRPWWNGLDLTRRYRGIWIIDFDPESTAAEASQYEAPFEHLRSHVKPKRDIVKRKQYRDYWWIHAEPCVAMRNAIAGLNRSLVTATLTKHRLFGWADGHALPDHQLIAFARADDYFFGVLHGTIHELWARRMGTQLREAESGFRYTPTTCFETFPLPWPPGKEPKSDATHKRISEAARELNEQRERWLNPPEWIEPIARAVDAEDDFADVPAEARPLIRQSAIMARAAKDARLKKRTLTNLYNERPTWLRLAHEKLDRAVLAAYSAVDPAGEWSEDWAEVWTETGAGQQLPEGHALAARRAEIDQRVLGN
ncbi:MAG: class I SAM-dependent DNA methyltransferase, partial [Planctomycetes bacterium]|nr:class I SAM-dependent DNA methyltransferase [Planctomycetota bacterium]